MTTIRGRTIETLFTEAEIAREVARMAREIAATRPDNLLVVAVLKGAFMFAADLARALHREGVAPELEFISLSSYGTGTVGGDVRITRDVEGEIAGRHVLIADDILESGRTLVFARNLMLQRGATGAEIAVLLDKHEKRTVPVEADYVGFRCPDHFVVGYGMDVAHQFRELPFIGRVV